MDTHLIGKAQTLLLLVLAFYRTETLPLTGITTGVTEIADAAAAQAMCDVMNFANLFCSITNIV